MRALKTISLTEAEYDAVAFEIDKFLTEFQFDGNVECIYYAPYVNNYKGIIGKPVIMMTLICHNINDTELRHRVEMLNSGVSLRNGHSDTVKVFARIDSVYNYNPILDSENNMRKITKLCNSSILVDRHDYYRELKEEFNKDASSKFTFYNPNIGVLETVVGKQKRIG